MNTSLQRHEYCFLSLTIKAMDTHNKMDAIVKFLLILFRGKVGQVGGQVGEVTVQGGLEVQLFQQVLFGLVKTLIHRHTTTNMLHFNKDQTWRGLLMITQCYVPL